MYKLVFVVTLLGLVELLGHTKDLSLFRHTMNTSPWPKKRSTLHPLHTLLDTVFPEQLDFREVDSRKVPWCTVHFPNLGEHQEEIVTKGTFKGILLKTAPDFHQSHWAACNSACTTRITVWCDLMLQHFTSHFLPNNERPTRCNQIVSYSDLRKLCQLPSNLLDEGGSL